MKSGYFDCDMCYQLGIHCNLFAAPDPERVCQSVVFFEWAIFTLTFPSRRENKRQKRDRSLSNRHVAQMQHSVLVVLAGG